MREINGIKKEIQNQNQKLRPVFLANTPAAIWGKSINGSKNIKSISTIWLNYQKTGSILNPTPMQFQALTHHCGKDQLRCMFLTKYK